MTNDVRKRRLLIKLGVTVIWIALAVIIFVLNRGHSLLIDNRNVEDPAIRAPDLITVAVNKQKPLEFFRGDRDIFKVAGSKQRIVIEFSDGTPPFEKEFNLPLGPDMFLLSIPKMINGEEPFYEVFVSRQESRNVDETETIEEEGIMGMP